MAGRIEHSRLRAPAEDGDSLIDPCGRPLSELIYGNIARRAHQDVSLHGRLLSEIADRARQDLLRDAQEYGRHSHSAPFVPSPAPRIYLTGHQPELFHPGVWLKNFVLDALAKRDGAAAVHVLIDNDEVRSSSIRVPAGSTADPRMETIVFDAETPAHPWEERNISNAECFRTFGRRVEQAIQPFVDEPLAPKLWADVDEVLSAGTNLGQCLAALRHRVERAWGLRTFELPLSQVCRSEAFHWFTAYLLAERSSLARSYNQALAEYRQVHRLRSTARPLPDLTTAGDWLEAPYWLWSDSDPHRRRVFVRQAGSELIISDHGDYVVKLPAPADGDVSHLAAELAELEPSGLKLRPRALVTTMYLRTVLSDLFIHGIGGAKYDQVTDCLIADLFGIQPPGFVTVTGTRHLPVDLPAVSDGDIRRVDELLRDAEFHPERFIDVSATERAERDRLIELLDEKKRLIAERPPPGEGRKHREALIRVNQSLGHYVSNRKTELLQQREELGELKRRIGLLQSREFSFCLFSEAGLRPWLLDAAAEAV